MNYLDLSKRNWTLPQARKWCSELATSHYENFQVGSVFLSPLKMEEYTALYAFARISDDLADESESGKKDLKPHKKELEIRLNNLKEWERQLKELYQGCLPVHPVYIALEPVIHAHQLEIELLKGLLRAFRDDQLISRYKSWEDVLKYTSGSADPVGRLVLRLYGYKNPEFDYYSDQICTALQLVNFIQDICSDLRERQRIYLPLDDLHKHNVSEEDLLKHPTPQAVRELLKYEAERAEELFRKGKPLLNAVDRKLRRQLSLFYFGGRAALNSLKEADFIVSSRHVEVTKVQKLAILASAFTGNVR